EASLGPRRFNLRLFAVFSLTGVLLAMLGLYSLVSFTVSQRRQEIGLRMAIGATERGILRMIIREAGRLGLASAALGGLFGRNGAALGIAACAGCFYLSSISRHNNSTAARLIDTRCLAASETSRAHPTDARSAKRVRDQHSGQFLGFGNSSMSPSYAND